MSTGRMIWGALLAFVVALFFFIIPVDVFDHYAMLLSFLAGACIFVCLFMALGDFESAYEIFAKPDPGEEALEPAGRKYSYLAIVPGILTVFILIFWQSSRVTKELKRYAVLTKGVVVGGQSTKSTRRMNTTTTYDIRVSYRDSLNREHVFEDDVSGQEFNNLYAGAVVDVVYSKRYPALAKAVITVDELAKYKAIPRENLGIMHLTSILDGRVRPDSILSFLNSVNYEWTRSADGEGFINEKLDMAVKVNGDHLAFIQKGNLAVRYPNRFSFQEDLIANGFKKKGSTINGESQEIFYNDNYLVSKEVKRLEDDRSNAFSFNVLEIFYVEKAPASIN